MDLQRKSRQIRTTRLLIFHQSHSDLNFRYALKELNLLGEDMHYVPLEEIGIMRNLRSVGLSKVRNYGAVTPSQASSWIRKSH